MGILLTPILNEINIDCIPHIFPLLVKKHKMFWVKKELKCYTIVIIPTRKKTFDIEIKLELQIYFGICRMYLFLVPCVNLKITIRSISFHKVM